MVSNNKNLMKVIERIKEKTTKENEMFLIIMYGEKGCGKTMGSQEIGMLIDPTLDITRICFDKEEFIDESLKNRNKVIIGDEGIQLFFNRASMTKEAREINAFMEQCRILNHTLIINIPKLLSVDPMILEDANLIIYVWKGKKKKADGTTGITKGNMAFYPKLDSHDYAARLIKHKKKVKSGRKVYSHPRPAFTEPGTPITMNKEYPVGTEAYNRKRFRVLDKYNKVKDRHNVKIDIIKDIKQKHPHLTDKDIGIIFNLSRERVNTLRNRPVKLAGGININ